MQARLNRPDTYTPYGSLTYEDVGGDRWRIAQTFSPDMQSLYDTQMDTGQGVGEAALNKVGQLPTDPFTLEGIQDYRGAIDYNGLTDIPGMGDFNAARISAEEGAFGRVWDRMGTQFDEEASVWTTAVQGQRLHGSGS